MAKPPLSRALGMKVFKSIESYLKYTANVGAKKHLETLALVRKKRG